MNRDPWKSTAFDREHMARALFEQLQQHNDQWVAVRLCGTGWEIVLPRSQEAILEACKTQQEPASSLAADAGSVPNAIAPGTPLPWTAESTDVPYAELGESWTLDAAGNGVATFDGPLQDREQDARYAAHTCNLYPELLAALEGLLDGYIAARRFDGVALFEIEQERPVTDARAAISKARTTVGAGQ